MTEKSQVLDQTRGLGVAGFLERYTPTSLTPEQWEVWRKPVSALVLQVSSTRNAATVNASALCEAISESGAEPGTPLDEVLRSEVINRVANARRRSGRSNRYSQHATAVLARLQTAALGVAPRPRATHPTRTVGATPSLAALRTLAAHDDAHTRNTAQQLLVELEELRPRRWNNPLPASEWRLFRTSPQVTDVVDPLRWDKLRSERVWEEMHQPTPAIQLIIYLRYTSRHWNWLAARRLDVRLVGSKSLRGCTIKRSRQWIVKDVRVTPSEKSETARKQSRRRASSKAEARRIAQEHISALQAEPEPLSAELEHLLEAWVPKGMPARDWLACQDLVHDVMRRAHIRGVESFRKHLRILSEYIAWAIKSGYPEDVLALMTDDAINDFSRMVLAGAGDATAGTKRSKLRALARTVNPEKNVEALGARFGHTDVKPPYTQEDVYWITRRISQVRKPTTRRAIQTAVALGLGAGLTTGDLQPLTRGNIDDQGDTGICITITGRNPRTIWLRHEYEEMLREGISHLSAGGRILGLRHHKDTVRDLYRNIQPTGSGPTVVQSRLRNTWLAHLMCEPIPLVTVMRVAGLATARTLTDLAPFIHEVADEQNLRGAA
jgi:hypothetical protein